MAEWPVQSGVVEGIVSLGTRAVPSKARPRVSSRSAFVMSMWFRVIMDELLWGSRGSSSLLLRPRRKDLEQQRGALAAQEVGINRSWLR